MKIGTKRDQRVDFVDNPSEEVGTVRVAEQPESEAGFLKLREEAPDDGARGFWVMYMSLFKLRKKDYSEGRGCSLSYGDRGAMCCWW